MAFFTAKGETFFFTTKLFDTIIDSISTFQKTVQKRYRAQKHTNALCKK